jgi:hypothetical protein
MIYMILALMFGQQINFTDECDSGVCVIDNIPFGVGMQTVDWQMSQMAPSAVHEVREGGVVDVYHGYKFMGMQETRDFQFVYTSKGQMQEIGMILTPSIKNSRYPEVMNLYFTLRDAIQHSGLYDSIEFMYAFKNPFNGSTEKDAIEGTFAEDEEDALLQDRNGKMSKYRFGKIWGIFQNKKRHSVKAVISVSIPEGMRSPAVVLQYYDTRFTNGGYVRGIDTTITMR